MRISSAHVIGGTRLCARGAGWWQLLLFLALVACAHSKRDNDGVRRQLHDYSAPGPVIAPAPAPTCAAQVGDTVSVNTAYLTLLDSAQALLYVGFGTTGVVVSSVDSSTVCVCWAKSPPAHWMPCSSLCTSQTQSAGLVTGSECAQITVSAAAAALPPSVQTPVSSPPPGPHPQSTPPPPSAPVLRMPPPPFPLPSPPPPPPSLPPLLPPPRLPSPPQPSPMLLPTVSQPPSQQPQPSAPVPVNPPPSYQPPPTLQPASPQGVPKPPPVAPPPPAPLGHPPPTAPAQPTQHVLPPTASPPPPMQPTLVAPAPPSMPSQILQLPMLPPSGIPTPLPSPSPQQPPMPAPLLSPPPVGSATAFVTAGVSLGGYALGTFTSQASSAFVTVAALSLGVPASAVQVVSIEPAGGVAAVATGLRAMLTQNSSSAGIVVTFSVMCTSAADATAMVTRMSAPGGGLTLTSLHAAGLTLVTAISLVSPPSITTTSPATPSARQQPPQPPPMLPPPPQIHTAADSSTTPVSAPVSTFTEQLKRHKRACIAAGVVGGALLLICCVLGSLSRSKGTADPSMRHINFSSASLHSLHLPSKQSLSMQPDMGSISGESFCNEETMAAAYAPPHIPQPQTPSAPRWPSSSSSIFRRKNSTASGSGSGIGSTMVPSWLAHNPLFWLASTLQRRPSTSRSGAYDTGMLPTRGEALYAVAVLDHADRSRAPLS